MRIRVWMSDVCSFDLSGGVQEEAPSLGKPVLVMRETTERPEGVAAGTAKLVGTDKNRIVTEIFNLLDDSRAYAAMSRAHNPFGDGKSGERIARIIANARRRSEGHTSELQSLMSNSYAV